MTPLVLSLFPGIGLLDRAFEEEGFCVVRGPDLIWGGNVRRFYPPAGRFDGVIGGPPCQAHSNFRKLVEVTGGTVAEDLIPEFARCVNAARPYWFLMENVPAAPLPDTPGYGCTRILLNNRWCGGEQNRLRSFAFGSRGAALRFQPDTEALETVDWCNTVLASGGIKPGTEGKRGRRRGNEYGYHGPRALAHAKAAQGLPADFLDDPPIFKAEGKFLMIGNGVPLPMGRAVARAVKQALKIEQRQSA